MTLQDILAAIAVVINGLPQGLLALNFGFAAFPTALAFIVGGAGMAITGQVAPISFQAETIVLAGTLGEDRNERLNIVFFTGILMLILGGIGLLEPIIDFIGPSILNGMMAGVGIILARVGINMLKENPSVGVVSGAIAVLVYFITYDLVYTIVASVFISTAVSVIRKNGKEESEEIIQDLSLEKFDRLKLKLSPKVIRNILAVTTLQVGGNIAYASITGDLANTPVNVDHVTVYSGVASSVSAFFGGGPVEAIISGTGVAPNPQLSGIIMMGIMAVVLLMKLLPRIAKHVPSQSIAGFLFVLGAVVVFPNNIGAGIEGEPMVAGVTTIVTASSDPFLGMVAGIVVRFLTMVF